ncbi:hypothetical protein C1645_855006 [Glomus cerebriforme]|uniref:F-box domain-containing protein n=1 Tax=Glomus cerebriforme TaxID=658196 RepID=A0A397SLW2_9GLOM|nr:hypothetical protein C1645_855006 [Glomus cerebriforme]
MSLSEDCILEILEYLSDDKKSLYSCLLTNRLFCRFAVKILWRDPWIEYINSNEKNYWNILGGTITKCFSQEIKQTSSLLKKHKQIHLLKQPPLFNYVLHIQIITVRVINELIKVIFDDIDNKKIEQKFNETFWLFFIKRCPKIKSLDIPKFNLFIYPESKKSLSSLSTLKVNVSYPKEIILELSKNVHTLKRIEFHLDDISKNSYNNDTIKTLILSQKNLREIKFIFVKGHTPFFNKKITKHLSQSLRTLELCNCTYLSVQTISNFTNLTELKICFDSLRYNGVGFHNLKEISLPKLEILYLISFREGDFPFLIKLIESTKGSLKILNVRAYKLSAISLPLSLIGFYLHTIKTTCPNIEVLSVWLIPEMSLEDFEDLLKSCSKIRTIIIHSITSFDNIFSKRVLHLLAIESSSFFLKNIHLIGGWKFSNLELEKFFDLWKEMKRKPLKFFSNNNIFYIYIKSNHIIKYSKQYICNICPKDKVFDHSKYFL